MRITLMYVQRNVLHICYEDGSKVIRYCPSDAAAQQRLAQLLEKQSCIAH